MSRIYCDFIFFIFERMRWYLKMLGLFPKWNGRGAFFGLLGSFMILSFLSVIQPYFVKEVIDSLYTYTPGDSLSSFFTVIVEWGSVLFFFLIGRYLVLWRMKNSVLPIYTNEAQKYIQKLLYIGYGDYLTLPKGKFSKMLYNGLESIWSITHSFFMSHFRISVEIIMIVIIMFWYNRRLALVTLSMLPILFLIVFGFNRRSSAIQEQVDTLRDSVYDEMGDSLINHATVKSFQLEDLRFSSAKQILDTTLIKQVDLSKRRAFVDMYVAMITGLARLLLICYGVWLFAKGLTTIGEIVMFFWYVGYVYFPLIEIFGGLEDVSKQTIYYKRLIEQFALLEQDTEQTDEGVSLSPGRDIVFDSVSFAYHQGVEVFNSLSFTVPSGKTVAIVGSTGSGKSTISHLVQRFWKVSGGTIFFGNEKINDISLTSLRKYIGVVHQDTTLFNSTIYNNLLWSMGLESGNERVNTHIKDALRFAQADFVFSLENGRNTLIGERGLKLSGGEKQRIALARLLLKNPELIIMDEATSALDNATEFAIKKVIDEKLHGKTKIIIAHRLTTIQEADHIIVLGKDPSGVQLGSVIIEQGKYQDLLAQKGVLWGLAYPEKKPEVRL